MAELFSSDCSGQYKGELVEFSGANHTLTYVLTQIGVSLAFIYESNTLNTVIQCDSTQLPTSALRGSALTARLTTLASFKLQIAAHCLDLDNRCINVTYMCTITISPTSRGHRAGTCGRWECSHGRRDCSRGHRNARPTGGLRSAVSVFFGGYGKKMASRERKAKC